MRWKCSDRVFEIEERPLVMGILNVTPDSFSDGGRFYNDDKAVEHGLEMVEEGADIIDVGGASTRPGASEIDPTEEANRVMPIIKKLAGESDVVISIDTTKAVVAERALRAGAMIINDVSAFTHDPDMSGVAAEYGAGVVLMHMSGDPQTMQDNPRYRNVVSDVSNYLEQRVEDLAGIGLNRESMAVDPGIGFGKMTEHNLRLLSNLGEICAGRRPVVVGLSRKSFLGKLTGREVDDRLAGSLSALVYCILNGAHIMRVHDVKESIDAIKVAIEIKKYKQV